MNIVSGCWFCYWQGINRFVHSEKTNQSVARLRAALASGVLEAIAAHSRAIAGRAGLEVAVEMVDHAYVIGPSLSSSDSARSAQFTPDGRTLAVCDAAVEGTVGELAQELAGELAVELAGERFRGVLHGNSPDASSSAAFSCTHSG